MIPPIHMSIMMLITMMLISLIFSMIGSVGAYRIKGDADETNHFVPYEIGNVGNVHQFTTAQTWSNQGYTDSIVLGDSVGKNRLTSCPKMIGPINGEYFCSDIEKGYCDRRSGTCFCNDGYMGDACDDCAPTHVKRGGVCYPKTPCPNDCSRFGECNFQTGICDCSEFREGADCSQPKCSRYHEFCKTCDEDGCIECESGYSSHKTAEWGEQCQPCWRFDPRCRTCSEEACTSCVDLLLLSIHRSGRRPHDPPLPVDELMRELSVTVPFGSTQEDAFYDAENYFLVDSSMAPLNESAMECHQGLNNDASISCTPYNLTSHIICGNHGTITFDSPEYAVREDENHVRLTLRRSGGGVGEVTVSYSVYPITAGYEDVSSTAYYTTNRTIVFRPGQITASFLVTINDDRIMEPDEIFSVHLSNPTGGASLGTQQRTIVTIIDDDSDRTCSHAVESDLGTTVQQPNIGVAGDLFEFSLFANTCAGSASTEGGGDMFKVVARKHAIEDSHHTVDATGSCEHALENAYYCSMNTTTSGDYKLDVYHLIPGGLKGYYFTDNFLDDSRLDMVRIDASLNFTWGTGPVSRFARDYLSVRWEGYVRHMHSETYSFWLDVDDHARLWIDGNLLIDWWTFPAAPSSMLHAEYNFTALETYEIVLEYRDILGNATSRLLWSSDSTPITAVPSSSLYYKEPIQGSPFDCVILPAATDASQSRAIGEDVHYAIAGQQHTFAVIPNDLFGNFRGWPLHSLTNDERHLEVFHATAQLFDVNEGEAGASINIDVSYDESSRMFAISYNPTSSGFYQLNVTYDSNGIEHISGSPMSLQIVPGETFAQESITFGRGLEHGMAGELSTATIQSFDANRNKKLTGGDDWKVTLTSVITNEYGYGRVKDHNNGTYTLQVVPSVAGPNELSITLNGSPIRGSPFRMNVVHNEVDSSSSFIVNKADVYTMIAMREATIIVQANDSWGNMAIYCDEEPYHTSVMVQSDSIDEDATNIRYIGGGKYEVSVVPVMSGEETYLEIWLNGMDIVDSPLLVAVKPGNFAANTSIATGTGLRRAKAGVESFFFIQSKDEGGNNKVLDEAIFNVTLTLVERAGIPTGIESQTDNATDDVVVQGLQSFTHDGRYVIQYTCFVAGMYDLYVSDDKGNSVIGSPFRVEVVPSQLSGERSIVTGEGTIQGVAGKVAPVRLFLLDRYGNFIYDSQETVEYELSLQSRHQSRWEDDDNIEQTQRQPVRASGDGSFNLDYVTIRAGVYSLDITTFLPGGLEASYFSSPDFSQDYLVVSSIEDNVDTNWTTLSYSYTCAEEHACANLLSDVIDPYYVSAKWSGKLKADVNEEYSIRVECNDGGQTSFTIAGLHVPWQSCWPYAETKITLPTNGVDLLLKYKNFDGVDPFVVLKWSSSTTEGMNTIPSSNLLHHQIVGNTTFYPTTHPDSVYAPNSIAMGDSLRHAVSGIEQEFLVECRDSHGNLLLGGETITLVSSGYNTNALIQTTITDNKNGTYSVRYTPVLSGEYLLSVQIGELGSSRSHIKESPFRLKVLPGESDPTESILVLNDDGKGVAGSKLISSLHTFDRHGNRREKGGDKVLAYLSKVSDEKYQYECGVDDIDTGIYIIDCPSQWEATEYLLDVSLVSSDGVSDPLDSSPFNVTVLPGDAFAATTSITSGGTPIINQNGIPSVHFITDAGSWSSFVLSAKDSFSNYLQQGGNHFVTQIDGNSSVTEVQVVDQGYGDYIVAFKVGKSSTHKLEIGMVAGKGLSANYCQIGVDDGPVESMIDEQIDYHSWRLENSVPFSRITWIGYISFPHAGQFEFELAGVEGQCKLVIGHTTVIDTSVGGSIGSFDAMDNVLYELEVEYLMNVDRLLLKLYWSSTELPQQIVPSDHLFHSSEPIHGSPFSLTIV